MRLIGLFILIVSSLLCISWHAAFATVSPVSSLNTGLAQHPLKVTPPSSGQPTGKKLTWFQKLELKLLQRKVRKHIDDPELIAKQMRLGRRSLLFGILGFVLLFIPGLGLLGLASAILAVVFGSKSLKYGSNTNAIIGTVLGSVLLFLFLLAIIIVVAYFSFL